MILEYQQKGETINYVNGSGAVIPAGTVVPLGTRIGVAAGDIPVGATGALHLVGVFRGAKVSADVVTVGAAVYYKAADEAFTTTATGNTPAGFAVEAAGAGVTTLAVKIG